MMSYPYIIEIDDMLTETDFNDVSLVEDLFQLLDIGKKVRSYCQALLL